MFHAQLSQPQNKSNKMRQAELRIARGEFSQLKEQAKEKQIRKPVDSVFVNSQKQNQPTVNTTQALAEELKTSRNLTKCRTWENLKKRNYWTIVQSAKAEIKMRIPHFDFFAFLAIRFIRGLLPSGKSDVQT